LKKGKDLVKKWKGFSLIHHNLPGDAQALHAHAEHQVFIPLSGRMQFTDELGMRYNVNRESMFFIPARALHSFKSSDEQGERVIMMISPRVWGRLVSQTPEKMVTFSSNQLAKELSFYLLTNSETPSSKSLIQSLVMIMGDLTETPKFQKAKVKRPQAALDPRMRKAVEYIDRYYKESISIGDIAKKSGVSSRNLNRLFQAELSITPKHYLISKRIEYAKSLLKQKGSSVTETAFECGYKSLSQFIKTFHKVTGKLPSEFLK
jgi:AraC-like DNA-binding protein